LSITDRRTVLAAVATLAGLGSAGVCTLTTSSAVAGTPATTNGPLAGSSDVAQWGLVFESASVRHKLNPSPTQVPGLTGVTAIQAGNADAYAISAGNVWSWGYGADGELGDGSEEDSFTTPVKVSFPTGTTITAIGEAFDNGYAIDSTGKGWAWGKNTDDSLCLGVNHHQLTPQKVTHLPSTVSAVQGGESHVLWLGTNGDVYACGKQPFGQLGNGSTKTAKTPVQVQGLPTGDPVVAISAGDNFSAALTKSGKLFMWGADDYGQLGNGTMTTDETLPVQVPGTYTQVDCGGGSGANATGLIDGSNSSHTVAITTAGTVEAWGNDSSGQLGDGKTTNEDTPVDVKVPAGVTFAKVVAGGVTSGALDSKGNVWTWGSGAVGQLGNGEQESQSFVPVEVDQGKTMLSTTASDMVDG
jgi:alpha-tubulin suppressor-like RCC1 family protein